MKENNITLIKKREYDPVDIENDYTLPDYITDVRKLVGYESKAKINNVYSTDGYFMFEGEVTYSVIVVCEDNSIKNLIYTEEFGFNAQGVNSEICVHECNIETSSARLISPRKINCKSKIRVITKNSVDEDIDTCYQGVGMPEAEFTLEKKMSECEYVTFSDEELQNQRGSRDIELSSSKEEIVNIVYCRIYIRINERKLMDEKLFLRGETVAEILYEGASGRYIKICDRSPFNDVINNLNGTDIHLCDVIVSDIKAKARNNTFGEMKIIELDYSYSIRCRCYAKRKIELLCDAYSTEYDLECKSNSVSALKLNTIFSSSLSINDSCSIKEITDDNVMDIVDYSITVLSVNVKPDIISRKLIISGDLKIDVLYKAEEYSGISFTRPYKYEREYDGVSGDIYCDHRINGQMISCTVDNERLMINAEIYFNVMISEHSEYKYIDECTFRESESNSCSPVIIYYPSEDDTLWEIAKKYKTTCKDIISANNLTSESLEEIKVLLLPRKKQRSVYNTII